MIFLVVFLIVTSSFHQSFWLLWKANPCSETFLALKKLKQWSSCKFRRLVWEQEEVSWVFTRERSVDTSNLTMHIKRTLPVNSEFLKTRFYMGHPKLQQKKLVLSKTTNRFVGTLRDRVPCKLNFLGWKCFF